MIFSFEFRCFCHLAFRVFTGLDLFFLFFVLNIYLNFSTNATFTNYYNFFIQFAWGFIIDLFTYFKRAWLKKWAWQPTHLNFFLYWRSVLCYVLNLKSLGSKMQNLEFRYIWGGGWWDGRIFEIFSKFLNFIENNVHAKFHCSRATPSIFGQRMYGDATLCDVTKHSHVRP